MLRLTVILLALVFIVFSGNAYAWDCEVNAYVEGEVTWDFETYGVDSSEYGWSIYVNYQLHAHVSGNGTGASAFANLRNWDDTRYVDCYINYNDYDSKSGAFDTNDEYLVIMATATLGSMDWAEAYARFNWGSK